MRDETFIQQRIKSDFDLLENMGYDVVGVFLQGSQNYNLDHKNSDIDTKAIVLPKFRDFVLGSKQTSFTHVLPSTEHIDIKDIRMMFQNFRKQNINYIEILFTDYYYINPLYKKQMDRIMGNENIARYDEARAVKAMMGMSFEKRKALCHPYPTIADKIKKYGFDGKQLSHIFRLSNFLNKYIKGKSYKECMTVEDRIINHNILVKTNEIYDVDTAKHLADNLCEANKKMANDYIKNNFLMVNKNVDELLDQVIVEIFKQRFREYFNY